jgi:hypothetical protein
MVLWGRLQSAAPELTIVGRVSAGSSASGSAALERDEDGSPPRWYAGEALAAREGSPLEAEVARLERELQRERTRRAEREQAFLEFSRLVAQLPAARELGLAPAETPPAPPSPEELEREAAAAARRARGEELGRSLAVLMRLEGLRGLDLLESGALLEDPPVGIGPVVFRCLDEHGGLAGSLRAERLRLEGSLAAHTLTLVLEGGFESRGGERVPFANGLRRIALQDVDPEPWLEECPELFADRSLAGPADDGLWRLSEVRRELNRLLALEPSRGWYRVHSLGGVRGKTLRDVQLDELDPAGRVTRRFCADALVLALEDGSVALELEGGAIVSGSDKQPFRDGRYRIVLPGVALAPWRAAILPGLAPPPKLEGAPEPAGG